MSPNKRIITIVAVIEQLNGRHQQVVTAATGRELLHAQEKLYQTRNWLNQLDTLDFDEQAAEIFESLIGKKIGKLQGKNLLIAAIVLSRHYTLITRNVKHFQRVPGLKVEDWAR